VPAPFDAEALLREYGDTTLVHDLARLVVDTLPVQLNAVQSAIDKADGLALKASAHTLKGSVGPFAAIRAVELARRLETLGVSGNLAEARAVSLDLRNEVLALCASAQAWLTAQASDAGPS
jgi:HPt (histidine-containing phosphotransfer) domain-containing protein